MFDSLFSFHGRIARLAYLGWSIVALAVIMATGLAFLLLGAVLAAAGFGGSGPAVLGVVMASTMMVVAIWSGLALAVRRIRDTGYDPVVVIGLATIAALFDAVTLTSLTDIRFFWPFDRQTPLGAIITIGYFVFVLLWPSAGDERGQRLGGLRAGIIGWPAAVITAAVFVVATASAVLLTPTLVFERERHALSQVAMRNGRPSVAVALLRPLAAAGDPRALNNLGAMFVHGAGVPKDLRAAYRLFANAGAKGSVRGRVNLAVLRNGGCGLNMRASAGTAAALQPFVERDPAAPRLVQDCLYFDATADLLPDRDERFIESGARIEQVGDATSLLAAGWALLNRARTTKVPDHRDRIQTAEYEQTVIPIARKAMETLFAAAEAGATRAYEPLGILAMQFGERLGDEPLAVRLREKSNWEWIEEGAAKGDWEGQCKVAQNHIYSLRWNGRDYSRAEFDSAVAMARACIDRKDTGRTATWHDDPEWLALAPARRTTRRPHLVIAALTAELNGLMFFDANRQLGMKGAR